MAPEDFYSKKNAFLKEFEEYIGVGYLAKKYLLIGDSTRFDQLNFDIIDEVVTEHMIDQHFGLDGFTCDEWPDTIGELLTMITDRLPPG